MVAIASTLVVLSFQTEPRIVAAEETGSIAIVSSVNGEAQVAHLTGAQQPSQPKFRGPIIYGDHLSTGKDSTLGLLVGQNSLLTMRELSEVRIAETARNRQILEVAKGKVCLAVSRSGETGSQPFILRTPTSMITAAAGTLLSVDIEPAPQKSHVQDGEKGIVLLTATRPQPSKETSAPVVETYHVVEGSVDIVSMAPGPSPISLRSGQSLRVKGGVRGQPFTAQPVSCRTQEVQILPVHINTPLPTQRVIVQQQMQIATAEPMAATSQTATVAAMAQTSNSAPAMGAIPRDVQIPTTTVPPEQLPAATIRTTIQVRLP